MSLAVFRSDAADIYRQLKSEGNRDAARGARLVIVASLSATQRASLSFVERQEREGAELATSRSLAHHLDMHKAYASQLLAQLEAIGLVRRVGRVVLPRTKETNHTEWWYTYAAG